MIITHSPIEVEQGRWSTFAGWNAKIRVPSVMAEMNVAKIARDKLANLNVNIWPYARLSEVYVSDISSDDDDVLCVTMIAQAQHEDHKTNVSLMLSRADMQLLAHVLVTNLPLSELPEVME